MVAVQVANPEVGTLQPLADVAALAAAHDVPLFADAAASTGRVDLPDGWSAAAASAHKWGGPAGVGVLLVRKGARWRAPFPTDDRTDPRVAGFENVPAALAAAAALQAVVAERDEVDARRRALVDRVRAEVARIPDVEVAGHPEERLPHVVTFSCLYVDGEALVTELDRRGFAVASGSACTASRLEPSHVLAAMGAAHPRQRAGLARPVDVGRGRRAAARGAARRGRRPPRLTCHPVPVDAVDLELDCRGMRCPLPVIRLANSIGDVAVGATLAVVADDPAARRHPGMVPDARPGVRRRGRRRRRGPPLRGPAVPLMHVVYNSFMGRFSDETHGHPRAAPGPPREPAHLAARPGPRAGVPTRRSPRWQSAPRAPPGARPPRT